MAKSFTVYKEYYDLVTLLSESEQANVVLAIWKYMFTGKIMDLNDRENKVFINLKRPLDKSKIQSERRIKKEPNKNQKETKREPTHEPNVQPKENTSNDVDVNVNNYDNNYAVNVNVDNKDINNIHENNMTIDDYLEDNVYLKIEKELCVTISSGNKKNIDDYLKIFSEEIIIYAATKATAANVRKLSYVFGILDNWKENKLLSLEKIKESEATPKKSKNKSNLDTFDKVINNES